MQIGSRWRVGADSPASLPTVVHDAIAAEERELVRLDADTTSWNWTLTFLEGRPIVTLDDGTTITFDGANASVSRED